MAPWEQDPGKVFWGEEVRVAFGKAAQERIGVRWGAVIKVLPPTLPCGLCDCPHQLLPGPWPANLPSLSHAGLHRSQQLPREPTYPGRPAMKRRAAYKSQAVWNRKAGLFQGQAGKGSGFSTLGLKCSRQPARQGGERLTQPASSRKGAISLLSTRVLVHDPCCSLFPFSWVNMCL